MSTLSIALAQINPLVGDIPGNTEKVKAYAERAEALGADVILFPELTLSGYPPEDLLLRPSLALRIDRALEQLKQAGLKITLVLGYPRVVAGRVFNMAGVIENGELVCEYAKQCLPNYQVFDEVRYFVPGDSACVFDLKGVPTAITICEDIWQLGPVDQAREAGAKLMLNLNASPFHRGKPREREQLLIERARQGHMPIVYVNQVGGQDELVFDGGSVAVNSQGELCRRLPAWEESLEMLQLARRDVTCGASGHGAATGRPGVGLSGVGDGHPGLRE